MTRMNPLAKALGVNQEIDIDLIDINRTPDFDEDQDDSSSTEVVEIVEPKDDSEAEYAKATIKTMINFATKSVSDLATLASQSESPRAYEVLANMINTVVASAKDVVAIDLKSPSKTPQPPKNDGSNVTNNLFVGTTAEFAKIMKQIRESKDTDADIE